MNILEGSRLGQTYPSASCSTGPLSHCVEPAYPWTLPNVSRDPALLTEQSWICYLRVSPNSLCNRRHCTAPPHLETSSGVLMAIGLPASRLKPCSPLWSVRGVSSSCRQEARDVLFTARFPRAALAARCTSMSGLWSNERIGSRVSRSTSRTSNVLRSQFFARILSTPPPPPNTRPGAHLFP